MNRKKQRRVGISTRGKKLKIAKLCSFHIATFLLAGHAWALQVPDGSKNADSHICDVEYKPNDVVDIRAVWGDSVAVRLGPNEKIINVAVSDTDLLKYYTQPDVQGSPASLNNAVWLKARRVMPTQPINVRTLLEDGKTTRDYQWQWTALPDSEDRPPVKVAAAGEVNVEEVAPHKTVTPCYLIRYTYSADVKAAQIAAWRAKHARDTADAAEIALHQNQGSGGGINKKYTAQGDPLLCDTCISDDGYTTTLRFPGNTRLPIILRRTPEGGDAEVTGITTEQNGVVNIHSTLPFIRLRDGDQVMCITNWGYNQIGHNPGTGTSSPEVKRVVGSSR